MTVINTTSPTWNIDYRWNKRNQKEYFIQVFQAGPHQAERGSYPGKCEAREAALNAGLSSEAEI